jgi:hypothetical protein
MHGGIGLNRTLASPMNRSSWLSYLRRVLNSDDSGQSWMCGGLGYSTTEVEAAFSDRLDWPSTVSAAASLVEKQRSQIG